MKDKLYAFIVDRPIATLLLIVAITTISGMQLPKLYSDTDSMNFIPHGDPARTNNDLLETTFGSSYLTKIIVMRDDHPDGIFNPESLAVIQEITDWLATRPEFETATNADLRSLTTLNDIRGDGDGMVVSPFMEEVPSDRPGALAIRERIASNENYRGLLASQDGRPRVSSYARPSPKARVPKAWNVRPPSSPCGTTSTA